MISSTTTDRQEGHDQNNNATPSVLLPVLNTASYPVSLAPGPTASTAPAAAQSTTAVAAAIFWPTPNIANATVATACLPAPIIPSNLNGDDQTTTTLINDAIEKSAYHDYSRIPSQQLSHRISHQKRKKPTFPQKLHTILTNEELYSDIITWLPHGRAWKIVSDRRLEEEVLHKFFRHNSRASFLRQVNNWGFKRVLGGRDENAYYNEVSAMPCFF